MKERQQGQTLSWRLKSCHITATIHHSRILLRNRKPRMWNYSAPMFYSFSLPCIPRVSYLAHLRIWKSSRDAHFVLSYSCCILAWSRVPSLYSLCVPSAKFHMLEIPSPHGCVVGHGKVLWNANIEYRPSLYLSVIPRDDCAITFCARS